MVDIILGFKKVAGVGGEHIKFPRPHGIVVKMPHLEEHDNY